MIALSLIRASAFAVASLCISSAIAQAGTPASLGILPGTWNCTTHGSTGTSTGSVTFTPVMTDLVQFRWIDKTGKNAGHKGGGEWFYDAKKGQYVALGAGDGGWGVSQGKASADATSMTLTDMYPSDPTNGTTTYRFTQSKIAFTSDWKQSGKAMHIEQTCTRA